MEVSVSRKSPVEVKLTVALPGERVKSALDKAYTALSRVAQVRGFRKGKVPLPILKQYFAGKVEQEVTDQLVRESLNKALTDEKLEPITQPAVAAETPPGDAGWTYTADFEVRPPIEKINLESISLERKVFATSDADVDARLEKLRDRHAELRTPDPARPIRSTDSATIAFDVTVDGAAREDLSARNRTVEVGKGLLLKAIDDVLVGMNVNDTREATHEFPADHAREDLRGKKAIFKITVSEIREKILPALDDEFAKDTGAESLEGLRAKLRSEIEEERKSHAEQDVREAALEALAKANPIAVPPSLLQNATGTVLRELTLERRIQGEKVDTAALIEDAKKQAEERVSAGLLLTELARVHAVAVSEADIDKRLEDMAKDTGKAVARLRAEYRDAKKREMLVMGVLEDKVIDLLISKVTVKDVTANWEEHKH